MRFSPICPYCDSVAAHPVDTKDGEAFQGIVYTANGTEVKMYCRACGAIWADRYEVTRRTVLKKGVDLDKPPAPQTNLFTEAV